MHSDSIFSLWPILPLGADDDKSGANNGDVDNSQNSSTSTSDGAGQGNSSSTGEKATTDDEDDPYKGLSAKELKRLLADAETNGTTAAKELKKFQDAQTEAERKKNDDVTNLTNDLTAEKQTNADLRVALAKAVIVNEINADSQYQWNNAAIVAQQLDSEKVKVDDKGKISGLTKELARIAADPNLEFLQKKSEDTGNANGNNGTQQNNGPTGFQPGQGGASAANPIGGVDPAMAAELAKKMPALASRI